MATGAEPVRLTIPGHDLPHVCYLRTLSDSRRIIEKAKNAKRAVVIGASFIGLEVAASLRERKLEVAVVGKHSQPLEKFLGHELSNLIRETHETHGVKFHLGRSPTGIQDRHVQLDDGTILDGDLVVVGIGVRPNTALAEKAGIATDDGVLVNEFWKRMSPESLPPATSRAGPIRVRGAFGSSIGSWRSARVRPRRATFSARASRFVMPPFFWSNHFDLEIRYVGHGSRDDRAVVSGELKAKDASVIFRDGEITAVASVGRDLENLKAELALERGEEFSP